MSFFKEFGHFMLMGARAHAQWEIEVSSRILHSKRRLAIFGLLLLPILYLGVAFAGDIAGALPSILGGKNTYCPSFYTNTIFLASIGVGVAAGLITGCIGAGGGFIIAPALMSAGVKGILAVGTDLFHIFAKAIMGSVLCRFLFQLRTTASATGRLSGSVNPLRLRFLSAPPKNLRMRPSAKSRYTFPSIAMSKALPKSLSGLSK